MEVLVKSALNKLMIDLANLKPMLPGSISEQYNVCGKANCRCKDKVNPRKHGPQSRLSYTLPGKNSNIVIKKADVEIAKCMADNFKRVRQLIADISVEAIRIYREDGAESLHAQMEGAILKAKASATGAKPDSVTWTRLEASRDTWKTRAKERTKNAQKQVVTVRDLTNSREQWKKEAMASRLTLKQLEAQKKCLEELVKQQAGEIRQMEAKAKKKRQS